MPLAARLADTQREDAQPLAREVLPRQSLGGGKFIQNKYLCLFPLLKTTAFRGD